MYLNLRILVGVERERKEGSPDIPVGGPNTWVIRWEQDQRMTSHCKNWHP